MSRQRPIAIGLIAESSTNQELRIVVNVSVFLFEHLRLYYTIHTSLVNSFGSARGSISGDKGVG